MNDNYTIAALFAGGWRAEDAEELKTEYGLTDEETETITKALAEMEEVAQ